MNSMINLEVLGIIEICMKGIGIKSDKNRKIWENFARCTSTCTGVYRYTPTEGKVYRYMYRGVPVHPTRSKHVPVHVQGVPVHVSPKFPEC